MEWLNRLNMAMQYIEKHLDGEIELEKVAQIACCSPFHFQRMFSYIADVPLSEYVRRRRMTKAARELQSPGAKVVDIALKYGYNSPTAFNRAFHSVHGVAPSAAKEKGVRLKSYQPVSFRITIKGEAEMNYRIEEKPAFQIIGVKRHYSTKGGKQLQQIPKMWDKANSDGTTEKLCSLMDGTQPEGVLGVCADGDGKEFDYYIAVASNKPVPQGFVSYMVPAQTWAIFECTGPMPQALQQLQQRIVTEWLPNSNYRYANAPDIEVYGNGDITSEDYKSEVWLPIVAE